MASIKTVAGVTPKSGDSLTQDYTYQGFGTPKAAILLLSGGLTSETLDAHALLGMGFVTANENMYTGGDSDDNVTTTATNMYKSLTKCLAVFGKSTTVTATGALITDGVRLTFSGAASDNYRVRVILINDVLNAKVVDEEIASGANDITTIGFQPNLLFSVTWPVDSDAGKLNTVYGNNLLTYGLASVNESGGVSQCYLSYYDRTAQGTSQTESRIVEDAFCAQVTSGAVTWQGVLSDFDSSGFTITASGAPANDSVTILALEDRDANATQLKIVDTPTSTGIQSYSFDITPTAYIALQSINTALDTSLQSGTEVLGFSLGVYAYGDQGSVSFISKDGAGTSDTASYFSDSKVISVIGGDQNALYEGAHSSFSTNKINVNFSTVDSSARKVAILAIKKVLKSTGQGGRSKSKRIQGKATFNDRKNIRSRIKKDDQEWDNFNMQIKAAADKIKKVKFRPKNVDKPKST
jgi:hypothetical protein